MNENRELQSLREKLDAYRGEEGEGEGQLQLLAKLLTTKQDHKPRFIYYGLTWGPIAVLLFSIMAFAWLASANAAPHGGDGFAALGERIAALEKRVTASDNAALPDRISALEEKVRALEKAVQPAANPRVEPGRDVPSPQVGVPLGAILPYFGKVLPNGFLWADGESTWPNAEWVPHHLRGKRVPDMAEYLVGGTRDSQRVGVAAHGVLRLQGSEIPASFFLPKWNEYSIPVGSDRDDIGYLGVFTGRRDANKSWNAAGGVFHAVQAKYKTIPENQRIEFSVRVPGSVIDLDTPDTLPRHIKARWIIRVK
jgi:hypothetical protein